MTNTNTKHGTTPTYRNERKILRAVVSALIAGGYTIRVEECGELSEPLATPKSVVDYCSWDDQGRDRVVWAEGDFSLVPQMAGREDSYVHFIVSNGNDGLDVISDYGCSLSPIIDPIIDSMIESHGG